MLSSVKEHSPGLCINCKNAATCVYRAKRGFDAVYCENYDGFFMSSSSLESQNGAAADKPADISADSSPLKGLCVNCANRDSCKLHRPEAGVWHCEEYC